LQAYVPLALLRRVMAEAEGDGGPSASAAPPALHLHPASLEPKAPSPAVEDEGERVSGEEGRGLPPVTPPRLPSGLNPRSKSPALKEMAVGSALLPPALAPLPRDDLVGDLLQHATPNPFAPLAWKGGSDGAGGGGAAHAAPFRSSVAYSSGGTSCSPPQGPPQAPRQDQGWHAWRQACQGQGGRARAREWRPSEREVRDGARDARGRRRGEGGVVLVRAPGGERWVHRL
jgi:hypothetical protein